MTRFLRFFSFGKHSVKHASALLAITAIVSNVLGLGRNVVFSRFNSAAQLDVYFSSFRIADFLFNFLILGAITAAVIPVLSELVSAKKEAEAREITNELISWAIVIFSLLGITLAIFMPELVHLLVPGYDNQPDRRNLMIYLSRILLIQPIFFSVSFIIGALLNGYQRFSSYSLAPLLYNLSLIIGGMFSRNFGVEAITYSVIIGSLLHFGIQTREIWQTGFRFSLTWKVSGPLKTILSNMAQPNLAQGFGQLVLLLYTNLASKLPEGSYGIYSLINNLQTTPTVVVANSLAAASFPGIVGAITTKNWDHLNLTLAKVVRTTLFLLIPIVSLSLLLRAQVVRLYIATGHHITWEQTELGITIFSYFMLGVIPASLALIFSRLFYAHKDTKTPMFISFAGGLVAMITATVGIKYLNNSIATVAVAEALSSTVQCVLSLVILYRRRHFRLPAFELYTRTRNYVIGGVLMAAGAWGTLQAIDAFYQKVGFLGTDSIAGLFVQTLVATLVGLAIYFGYSAVISKEELQWVQRRGFSSAS